MGLLTHDLGFRTAAAPFDAGDVFVFCTDGITEAEDAAGLDFGRDHLAAVVRALRETYGAGQERKWWACWRVFFLACAEPWAWRGGEERLVTHLLFENPEG